MCSTIRDDSFGNPILCKDRLELCNRGFGGEVSDLPDNQESAIVVYHKQILGIFQVEYVYLDFPKVHLAHCVGDRVSFCCELL